MPTRIWECDITRRFKINRKALEFEDYTDWASDEASGRLKVSHLGNFLLTCSEEIITTPGGIEIEVVKNE